MSDNSASNDHLLNVIEHTLPYLLKSIETLDMVVRRLHPPGLPALVESVGGLSSDLSDAMDVFHQTAWPEELEAFRACVAVAGNELVKCFELLSDAVQVEETFIAARRALSHLPRAQEALFPVSAMLPAVSRFFMEPEFRDDAALCARLENADWMRDNVGLLHANNDWSERGGFSVYVPEYFDAGDSLPLILALHGASGHGRGQIWTWLREARTRGAIVVAPTSQQETWSLTQPEADCSHLDWLVEEISSRWPVDTSKMMVTGMGDGGTLAYLCALRETSPFGHVVPFSANFPPLAGTSVAAEHAAGLNFYIVHGALDWLVSPDIARRARDRLTEAGADVLFREVDDLSHTYARDENSAVLDWFLY